MGMRIRTVAAALAGVSLMGLATPFVTQAHAQDAARRNFNIPARDMAGALETFGRQSGRDILFDRGQVANLRSNAVRGPLEPGDALRRLVGGSGLAVSAPNGATFVVGRGSGEGQAGSAAADNESANSEILVTGTRIRGQAPVGSPLRTITREEIDQSGYATVQDLLRTYTVFGPSLSPGFTPLSNGLSLGADGFESSLDLRGLGPGTTLILVNGRRLPASGTAAAFSDISTIPTSAIDNIQILLDGASAIYGSDAVGGVVNITLRNDFQGGETRLRYGTYGGDAEEIRLSQSFGTSWSTGHIFVGTEWYKRTALAATDRDFSASSDQTPRGGSNFNSRFANPGNILSPSFQPTYGIPSNQDGTSLEVSDLLPGVINLRNINEGQDLLPEEETRSAFAAAAFNLSPSIEITAQGRYTWRPFERKAGAYPMVLTIPRTNPFFVSPYPQATVRMFYDGTDDFHPTARGVTNSYNGQIGLNIDLPGSWQARGSAGYGVARLRTSLQSGPSPTDLNAALADPNPATAFNPFGDGSNTNPQTLARLTRIDPKLNTTSTNLTADAAVDGNLFALPGGLVRLALGGSYVRDHTDTNGAGVPVELSRSVSSLFGELSVPIIGDGNMLPLVRAFDVSAALRFDHYSDFGSTVNPKFGLRWTVLNGLSIRSSWGTSFRGAPLSRYNSTFVPTNVSLVTFQDPRSSTGFSNVLDWIGVNPDLHEERSTAWTLGLDFTSRDRRTTASVTYTRINYEGRIGFAGTPGRTEAILLEEDIWSDAIIRNPSAEQIAAVCADYFFGRDACIAFNGSVIVDRRERNLAVTNIEAIDFQLQHRLPIGSDRLTMRLEGTYNITNELGLNEGSPIVDIVNSLGNPLQYRLRGSVGFEHRNLQARAAINYQPAYDDPVGVNGRPLRIGDYLTVDLGAQYDVPAEGVLRGLRLSLFVLNALDRDPPWANTVRGYDGANANPYGRQITLEITKQW